MYLVISLLVISLLYQFLIIAYLFTMLSLAWAPEHFEPYIYGKKFLVRTDYAALSWLETTKNLGGHMTRWLERIMEFMPYEIEHRQGKLHSNADGLSRIPWNDQQKTDGEILITDYSNIQLELKSNNPT